MKNCTGFNPVFPVILVLFSVIVLFTPSPAVIYYNDASKYFNKTKGAGESLKKLIVNNAEIFLGAYSEYLKVLQQIEIKDGSKLEYADLSSKINSLIQKMKKVRKISSQMVNSVDSLKINSSLADKLRQINFEDFCKKRRLNREIFNNVSTCLKKADFKSLLKQALSNADNILTVAGKIEEKLKRRTPPDIEDMWLLNELFAQAMLFGQYAARVFMSIN